MKISFEITEKGNDRINIHNMLISGEASTMIIAALPDVLGRIMGGIVRDCFSDPMARINIPKSMVKIFRKSMEDEIHGIEPMIDENLVKRSSANEHS